MSHYAPRIAGSIAAFAELSTAVFSSLPPNPTPPIVVDPSRRVLYRLRSPSDARLRQCLRQRPERPGHRPALRPGRFGPELPIEIWRNNGDGTFENRTADVLDSVVTTRDTNNVFVADLNGDGIDDIFIADQGFEVFQPGGGFVLAGARNKLVLSGPDGRLRDASSTLPIAYDAFNHYSAMVDFNGDGCLDFLITELGTTIAAKSNVYLLLNDCAGRFSKVTDVLPAEIRERERFDDCLRLRDRLPERLSCQRG